MAGEGVQNMISRRVMDDLIIFSGETSPSRYTKFLLEQKIAESCRFVKCIRSEVATSRDCIAQLNAVVAEFEAMENQEEVHDSWLAAKDARMGEQDRLDGLNELIDDALEEIEKLETNVEILEGAADVLLTSVSEDDSDIGSPGVDGPPIMPEDPYAYIMAAYGPLHASTSPTAESPGYIPESDPEEDPEEDPADYPADRDDDDEEEEEEEEEHPAPADFIPPVHRMTARISIRDEPSISLPPREEVERLLALPPPLPLTPLSSPLSHIPSPPLPASPPLQLLSFDHRTDRPKITLPPQKRLGIDLGPRYEIRGSSAATATRLIRGHKVDYEFVGTMDTEIR
ncbi:hypothetical protein Tco_0901764 [Tanacetum coccineum]